MKSKLINIVTVAASTLLALPAAADPVYYDPMSAIASTSYISGCSLATVDNDLDWWGKQADADTILAAAEAGSANAGAALSLPNVAVAVAQAKGGGGCIGVGASGILTSRATIYDPRGRGSVKVRAKFKAAGSSATPDAERQSVANWWLVLSSKLTSEPFATYDAWGDIVNLIAPDLLNEGTIFWIQGSSGALGATDGGVGASSICDSTGGCATFDGYSTEFATTIVFDATPGTLLFQLRADASQEGIAIIDPVIEPDPSNPDVVVTMEGPTGSGGYAPLAGVTADQLTARGIDPGPFIRLGFLDASAPPPPSPPPPPPPTVDTTPPTTLASANPPANDLGWNKTPVTITLGATDNVGGSGVKEVHYSLAGAATGSQVVPGANAIVKISAEGATTLTYFAVDNAGNQEAAKTLTVRIDQTPPTISGMPPSNCSLWPPDHRLAQVASVSVSDAMSGPAGPPIVMAKSNEPEDGTGDGDLAPDEVISGGIVQLRAERAGSGTGRIYTITATASDLAGNTITQIATCTVPHDRSTGQP